MGNRAGLLGVRVSKGCSSVLRDEAMTSGTLREAVGLPTSEPSLRAAFDELPISGFEGPDINVVAGHRSAIRKLGTLCDRLADLEYDPEAPVTGFVGIDLQSQPKASDPCGPAYLGAAGATLALVASGGTLAAAAGRTARAGGVGGFESSDHESDRILWAA